MEPGSKSALKTPDVIVIDCDDETKISDKNLSKCHKKKREVTLNQVNNLERILITQNVHVKEQKIKCVINLTTNVCGSQRKFHQNKPNEIIERIVPKCFRPKCQSAINNILKRHYECKHRGTKQHKRHKKRRDKSKKQRSSSKPSKKRHSKEPKKRLAKNVVRDPSLSLSSVSLSPFVSDLSYEDISPDSISWTSHSEDRKIDTLITKARVRETRQCVTPKHSEKPLYASTPENVIDLSSDEEHLKINESIHSLETFILEPQPDHMSSSNISSCIELYDEDNFKNSIPTIDLTGTSNTNQYCKVPSKIFENNNSIASKTNKVMFTDDKNLQHFELSLKDQQKYEKLEVKTECLKITKSFELSDIKKLSSAAINTSEESFRKGMKLEK